MIIRPARQADLPAIAALQAESWQDSYTDVLPAAYLAKGITADLSGYWSQLEIQPQDVMLVAEQDGMLGFIAVWCRPDAFIDNLHVRPAQRSKGVGRALMEAAARQLVQDGHRSAYLWVVASNLRAIAFYERLGGVHTAQAMKNLFGHQVLTVKLEWTDIAVIYQGG